jgi:hypothetical protein
LRDTIQTELPINYTFEKKKNIYNQIMKNMFITNIEVGSIVNSKVLPIMNDSKELLYYANKVNPFGNNYLLIPNFTQLLKIEKDILLGNVKNYSFITSASNEFQLKNTRKTLTETYEDIHKMLSTIHYLSGRITPQIKLYISCIDECPLTGNLDIHSIINEIKRYKDLIHNKTITNICLSDTCGTLSSENFVKIVDLMRTTLHIPYTNMGIHLHVNMSDNMRIQEIKTILYKSFDRGIFNYDVSLIGNGGGGCSVTMQNGNKPMYPNLTYDMFIDCLEEWHQFRTE